MASLTRSMLCAVSLLAPTACWSPPQTQGANQALRIYRRSARPDGSLQFSGPATREAHLITAEAPDQPLSVDNAITLAKRNSARLAELEKWVAAADAAIEAAKQPNNPQLNATNIRVARAIDSGKDLQVTPRLRFFPDRPGELTGREAEARAASREARAEARAEEMAIEAEVRWLFDDIVLLDAEVAAAERMANARRTLAQQTHEQLATATATAADASFADLHAILADGHRAERRARRALLVEALLDKIGRASGTRLELGGDPMAWPPPPLPPEQTLIETALKKSPLVFGAAARIDGASAHLHREQARRWPWFHYVEVGYEFQPSNTNVPMWTVGTAIDLPIFNANTGGIHRAEATEAAAQEQLEAQVQQIARDVRARLREVTVAATLVTDFRKVAVPALEEARLETEQAVQSGAITTLHALTIEERRCYVEVALFTLVRQYRTAVDALRRAVGGPLPSAPSSASK